MWLTMRSIRSAGLVGRRSGPPRPAARRSPRPSAPWTICVRRAAKYSRTWQSVGCTLSSTRSNTAKPTGLVSIDSSACLVEARRARRVVDEQRVAARAGGEAAEDQQVVPRRVVEVRWQLVVQQVRHVQVDELAAGPAQQRRLQRSASTSNSRRALAIQR